MYKLFAIVLAGVVGAGIWRRQELRNDVDRASNAVLHAASTARSRLPGATVDDVDGDGTGPAETAEPGDEAVVASTEGNDVVVLADEATSSA